MTDTGSTTESKKDDHNFDDMNVGSYLKERLAGSTSSSDVKAAQTKKESNESDQMENKKASDTSSSEDTSAANTKGVSLEPTVSTLVLSLSSATLIALGLAIDPSQGIQEPKVDKSMAKFNIDMLIMLKEKTKGNLSSDEQKLLDTIISDLQMKYVEIN